MKKLFSKIKLPRFNIGEPPKLDKKTIIALVAICAIYALLAFFRLGSTEIPQTSIYLEAKGQEVSVKIDEPQEISRFCFYKWRGRKNDIVISTHSVETGLWNVAYEGELSSHMRWKNLDLNCEGDIDYAKIKFEGKEITLAEIVILDTEGNPIGINADIALNHSLADYDNMNLLTDEQELFDEDSSSRTFAYFDEYLYALTSNLYIHGGSGLENTHPALGKVVIMLGILIFGMNPIGWRFFGTISGILMLPVMFFLARRVLRNNHWALIATLIMSLEAMHYTQTRLATIDSYPLLFILLAYLFMMKYLTAKTLKKELGALCVSGICFGLACSFKWIGFYSGVGLAICFFLFFASKMRRMKGSNPNFSVIKRMILTFACCVIFFITIPAVIYTLSYIPVAFGPYSDIEGWQGILDNQKYMWNFHSGLEQTFDFSSKWWQWPLLGGAFTTFFGYTPEGAAARIICVGSPMIWWFSIPAILFAVYYLIMGRRAKSPLLPSIEENTDMSKTPGETIFVECTLVQSSAQSQDLKNMEETESEGVSEEEILKIKQPRNFLRIGRIDAGVFLVVVAYLCQYVPWMLVSRELFIYHYFASSQIAIIAIALALKFVSERFKWGHIAVKVYLILTAVVFALMFPILNGFSVSPEIMKILKVFLQ